MNQAYQDGYADGSDRGWKDCAELARPYLSNLVKGHDQFVADVEHIVKLVMSTPKFHAISAPPQRMSSQRPSGGPALGKPAAPIKRSAPSSGNGDASAEVGAGGKRRILAALAQYPEGMNQRKLSILVDIAPKGGTWRTYMAELRGKGWVDGGKDHMRITDAGLEALGSYEPLPTGDELVQYWRNRLGASGKRAIFDAVVEVYPSSISVDDVSELTGIVSTGGTWRTYLAELRGLGIIEGRGDLQASKDLFS